MNAEERSLDPREKGLQTVSSLTFEKDRRKDILKGSFIKSDVVF